MAICGTSGQRQIQTDPNIAERLINVIMAAGFQQRRLTLFEQLDVAIHRQVVAKQLIHRLNVLRGVVQ